MLVFLINLNFFSINYAKKQNKVIELIDLCKIN